MRREIHRRHEPHPARPQMQPHTLHQRVPRLLLLHGAERRAHRLLLAEPAGGALHRARASPLLLQLHAGAAGPRRPARPHAHPPHPRARLPHAGHGGARGVVQQAQRHPGLGPPGSGVRGQGSAGGRTAVVNVVMKWLELDVWTHTLIVSSCFDSQENPASILEAAESRWEAGRVMRTSPANGGGLRETGLFIREGRAEHCVRLKDTNKRQ